ncbi:MAG: hypothetical protein HC820_04320 [Hydrococcus sp. RM1_1_31]|nr:hypothetical protein [Hydrococcus sp. RM1_1_31]
MSKIELDSGRKRVEMLSSEMISILQWSDRLLLDKVLLPNEFITIYGVKLSNDLTGFIYKCCKRYRHQYRHQSTLSFRWIALDGEGNLIGTYEQQSLAIFALLGWRKAFLCYCQNSLKNTYQEAIAFTLNKGILLLPVIGFWLINFIDFIYHTAIVSSSIGHLLIFGLSAIAFLIWFINL